MPSSCTHPEAVYTHERGSSAPWGRLCPSCGAETEGHASPEATLSAFGLSAERRYVENLMLRQSVGEVLKPHEEAAVGYSPYGTAASCNVRHARSFVLGST